MTLSACFNIDRGGFCLDVDLAIASSGVTALFGPSGCGKTTLLRAIAGLEKHASGQLSFNGEVWQSSDHFTKPHQRPLGYVFQEASLFAHLNVQQNLEYGLKRVKSELRRISLSAAIELLGIEPLLQRQPQSLSGGERQRVAIARALAVSPELLLMDEPLAALDARNKQAILPYLESLVAEFDIPIVYVSHSIDEVARLADQIVLMESGQVVAQGEPNQLLTRFDLPLARDHSAAATVNAVVDYHDAQYQLTYLRFAGYPLAVGGLSLTEGTSVRLQLHAQDVSITLQHNSGSSILNILPAVIDQISDASASQVLVRLLVNDVPVLSRITRKSAADLALVEGKAVFIQIKSVALL